MPDFATRRGTKIELLSPEPLVGAEIFAIISQPMMRKIIDDGADRWIVTMIGEPYADQCYRVTHVYRRKLEFRAGDKGHFRMRILRQETVNSPNGPIPGFIVEVPGINGPRPTWLPAGDMTYLEEEPDPAVVGVEDEAAGGAKSRGVAMAIAELWPEGIPTGLSGKDRDNAVRTWLTQNGHSVPADIARAVQRALSQRGR